MAIRMIIESKDSLPRQGGTLLSIKVSPMKAGPKDFLLIEQAKKPGK